MFKSPLKPKLGSLLKLERDISGQDRVTCALDPGLYRMSRVHYILVATACHVCTAPWSRGQRVLQAHTCHGGQPGSSVGDMLLAVITTQSVAQRRAPMSSYPSCTRHMTHSTCNVSLSNVHPEMTRVFEYSLHVTC